MTSNITETESNTLDCNPESNSGVRSRFSGGKLFNKKFANTSRFVVSSQVWMNTIPTRDCDILLTFPKKTDDATLMWLLARLRQRTPELAVHVRHHSNTGLYGFYLTATYDNLLRGAEDLGIRKPVKCEYGGGMKEFIYEDQTYFQGVSDKDTFFTTQEKQAIVKNMLFNLRAVDGDAINKIKFLEGQAIVPHLLSKGIAKGVLPIHNAEELQYLRSNWVQAFFRKQPLDKINEYFGVKIAMYFAYLGHYTKALILPAFLGLFLYLFSRKNQAREDVVFVIFSFFNVIWATLYLEHWKRRSAEQAYHWGTLDREDELLTEPRPLYHGPLQKSPITGRDEPNYPAWKRNLFRYCVSAPIILVCLSVVFVTMWMIFELQDWVNVQIKAEKFPTWFKFLPKILLAMSIGILDEIYKKIANWLNDMENYRLDETYENNLIIKLILFQFVNSYLSLFYIAFYLQDMDRLKDQLAALLITRQVVGNIKEALVPYIIEKLKLFRIGYKMTSSISPDTLDRQAKEIRQRSRNSQSEATQNEPNTCTRNENANSEGNACDNACDEKDEARYSTPEETPIEETNDGDLEILQSGPHLSQAEVEASMKKYEDTFEDYLEMLIQFGYVTLFSSAFPMAAMCALLNNIIEIRSDAFKLCMTFQRPFGLRVQNIGGWQDALEVMSVIAVMVNCALIGMSGLAERLFPDMGTTVGRILFIVILEHVILTCRFLLALAIPDIPDWVAEEKARLEFLRREALKQRTHSRRLRAKWRDIKSRLESSSADKQGSDASEAKSGSREPSTPLRYPPLTSSPHMAVSSSVTSPTKNTPKTTLTSTAIPKPYPGYQYPIKSGETILSSGTVTSPLTGVQKIYPVSTTSGLQQRKAPIVKSDL